MSSPVRNQGFLRTSNPTMKPELYQEAARTFTGDRVMTVNGTINCTGILLCLTLITAAFTWRMYYTTPNVNPAAVVMPWAIGGMIGGLILAITTMFKQNWSPFTAPLYALSEGLFLGGISAIIQSQLDEQIVIQAVALTFGVLFTMLAVYRTGLIKVTDKFRMGVVAATGGVMLLYLVSFVMSLVTGGGGIPFIHSSGPIGIGFSVFVVGLAALNLVLDFDLIENGAKMGAPKYMEWFGAFALMVTLIWLYIEILRLLSKIYSRR